MILPVDNSVQNPVDNKGSTATATAHGNPPARSEMASDLRKHDRALLTARKPPRALVKPQVRACFATVRKPHPYGDPTFRAVGPQGAPERHEEPTEPRSPNATDHPTSSTPPERLAPPHEAVEVLAMTGRTVEACERLFALMALEAVQYRREPAIVSRRPSWQAAYATAEMFAYGGQLDHIDTGEVA